jgi:hypothetical protein
MSVKKSKKSNKKLMAGTIITWKTKGKAKAQEEAGTKVGRELVPLMVGSCLTHNPSYVGCMQIMRSQSL